MAYDKGGGLPHARGGVSVCECLFWCRDWSETQNGKYPASIHHPKCENYKTEKFLKITIDNSSFVIEAEKYDSMFCELDDLPDKIETIELTREQFEKLPEFTGF